MTIDFHSHILPGIDDGSKSVEESVAMLQMEADQGIGRIVATPHFYARHDSPARFLRRRAEAYEKLKAATETKAGLPAISLGAEVYYFHGISECEAISNLTIDKTRYLLLEMPASPWNRHMYQEIEQIYVRLGLTPIIAHIDRYIGLFHGLDIPERLAEIPVLIQANAEFFLRPTTKGLAMRMLHDDRIHLLGSDCHNLTSRAPNMGKAMRLIENKFGRDAIESLDHLGEKVLCVSTQ